MPEDKDFVVLDESEFMQFMTDVEEAGKAQAMEELQEEED